MNQDDKHGSRSRGGGEEQVLLNEIVPRNGITITPTKRQRGNGGGDFEKQPFLPTEPVRLTPAWEETNLPNDELNFKGVTMEQAQLEMNPPADRFNIVYLILLLHGIGILIAWNMFITAKSYFLDYKLSKNYTGVESNYVTNFMPYIEFASQIPGFLFNWLNIFVHIGGNLTTRIVWSILVEVLAFVVTVILAMTDTSAWPGVFFWITIFTIVVINMANGVYQSTVYGMAAKLPFKYTGAIVVGSNISGTFTAIISIASSAVAPNVRTAAIYYFITALFVLLACFDTYFALPLNRFYRYHEMLNQKDALMKKRDNHGMEARPPYWKVFKQCAPQCFNVFFVFFVTLAIFPAVQSDIRRHDPDFIIGERYFVDITCFLTFNVCAMLGSFMSALGSWPRPKLLIIPVLLRALLIPLFLILNYQPNNLVRVFPIFITNDWVYWIASITLGLSSGYFSAIGMMYCPRTVDSQHAATAGMFGAASLISGICAGIIFSMTLPWFVSNVSW